MISISIVSHGQGELVRQVLSDLALFPIPLDAEVLVTLNLPEPLALAATDYPWPVRILENPSPKGFGANHNAAFHLATGQYFCVLNPDIHLPANPFPVLLEVIERQQAAVIAPAVLSPSGSLDDSIRRFPTLSGLARKALRLTDGRYPFTLGDAPFAADWVAGMFMLFRAVDYRRVGGFDENYFLYYEDADICVRLWKAGRSVLACPQAQAVHDARRSSRRNFRYMRWHAASLLRYLWKYMWRLPRTMAKQADSGYTE